MPYSRCRINDNRDIITENLPFVKIAKTLCRRRRAVFCAFANLLVWEHPVCVCRDGKRIINTPDRNILYYLFYLHNLIDLLIYSYSHLSVFMLLLQNEILCTDISSFIMGGYIMAKIKVCVIFGGMSSEYEVSLMSAKSVIDNIPADKYDIVKVGITKKGR